MNPNAVPSHPEILLPWYVNGTLDGEELRQVEEHLRSCLACRREVDELRQLRRRVKEVAGEPPSSGVDRLMQALAAEAPRPRRGWFRPWQPMLAAAVLAVAVGVSLWTPGSRQRPAEERSGEQTSVLWSRVDEEGILPRQAFLLQWDAAREWREAIFSVTVTEEDLTLVAQARGLDVMEYQVPAEALQRLPPGTRLLWQVEAERADGSRHLEVFKTRVE